jgi:hypothetical protein
MLVPRLLFFVLFCQTVLAALYEKMQKIMEKKMNPHFCSFYERISGFWWRQVFTMLQVFTIHQVFSMRRVFTIRQVLACTKFLPSAKFLACAEFLYIFFCAYIFGYFSAFLLSMRQ